ncbi:MAG: hypothetical protein FRX49_12524 [Trebouxia sp. A1-2]|nr:MAG: hypothetical protein FRX49_12524 [Trebouxia sp. A1-2]
MALMQLDMDQLLSLPQALSWEAHMMAPGQDKGKRTGSRWWLPASTAGDPPVSTAHKNMVRPVNTSTRLTCFARCAQSEMARSSPGYIPSDTRDVALEAEPEGLFHLSPVPFTGLRGRGLRGEGLRASSRKGKGSHREGGHTRGRKATTEMGAET